MVAGLLYLIGLVAVLASVAIAGYGAPAMIQAFSAAMDSGEPNMFGVVMGLAGMLYIGYGKKNADVRTIVIGVLLTIGSMFIF